jgi:hypothetical protein
LERLSKTRKIEWRMLHFKSDSVQLGAGHGNGAFDIDGSKSDKSGLTLLEGFDYAVKAGYVWHILTPYEAFKSFKMFKPFKSSEKQKRLGRALNAL